ncbi:MFS transporter [Fodinicola feengrottensis]|uniref:MFS transporter n=1 Tax=Fodinicola feengrottensis TaxID=435914 RepID=UPI0013D256B2|nr:MFS transporter [Fodinicola feengrottensis]
MGAVATRKDRAASYREVFANGEFRSLWLAELVSDAGDQVARVALSLLVFYQTKSAALTALAFALSFLPALFGPLLAGLADRYPRRRVMLTADLLRGSLMAAMAIPGVPLPVRFALLFLTQLAASPSNAARGALLADVLTGDQLTVGQGLRSIVGQIAQVGGFAVGGGADRRTDALRRPRGERGQFLRVGFVHRFRRTTAAGAERGRPGAVAVEVHPGRRRGWCGRTGSCGRWSG